MRVRAGVFSLTAAAPADDDGSYLRWHLLDHMPEQYQLPGIVYGLRWIADGDYPQHRLAGNGPLAEIANAVHYLVGDPVEQTFDDFVTLGRALRENGRFPVVRPSLQVAGLRLLQWQSAPHALISAEVVPFRPHRGVVLIVEEPVDGRRPDGWLQWLHAEHHPALLATPGTAGAWTFGSSTGWSHLPRGWSTEFQYITVVYLDADPLTTTAALAPSIEDRWRSGAVRPSFAGPLRSMVNWEAWR
ncbi:MULTISPECIES: hypothetical protein [unclassified Mycobacterium]|uniref:hypothetical protein n=1 Tax=unclassified Mycobacterium TaxID=2642494 RepID=UPI00080143EF|nr:hypothetical protein A5704_05430 [Mycobacterium sp. E735]OBG62294.1 hypothetical protein A5703_21520 [Mycobacterium sp. E188]OBH36544.1 hypothetical protein A5691_03995 [Mycobacterium sp. E183]